MSECDTSAGPLGLGHVKITFATTGNVSNADVDVPPFAGTAVGACIANKFLRVSIPAFKYGPVTVGKRFKLCAPSDNCRPDEVFPDSM